MRAAIYARYSTDLQRNESLEDQIRACRGIANRHDMRVVNVYSDAAMSGGTALRPDYQRMLAAARRREFDVIVAEDTSRLWRNLAEQSPRLAEFADLGIHVVTLDIDTRTESAAILGAVKGAMGEEYRREIGRRTRRGLEGNAQRRTPTGGRAYGYDCANQKRSVNEAQAAVVRRVFQYYADGHSPRAIAEILNREGVTSPGSLWNRTERRRSGWQSSAIAGDAKRGVGMLNCETYVGRVVWNRVRWVRSAADSAKRRCVPNPPSAWVVYQDEKLRIVSDDLWKRVKSRQAVQTATIGERVRAGLSKSSAKSTGRSPKFMLSGLMKCGECGARFVIISATHYGCASRANGGTSTCGNTATFRRDEVERVIVAGIRERVLEPSSIARIASRVRARLKQPEPPADRKRIGELKSIIDRFVDAIASGGLSGSPALTARLAAAEAELARLEQAAIRPPKVTLLAADVEGRVKRAVDSLGTTLASREPARARSAIREYLGEIQVRAEADKIGFWHREGHAEMALARVVGADANNCGSGGRI